MDKFGLSKEKIEKLQQLFRKYAEIDSVILYGSRAMGNYRPFSDIDITLKGNTLTKQTLSKLTFEIDDLLLPYIFDISIFHEITNIDVVDHINRIGQILYQREP